MSIRTSYASYQLGPLRVRLLGIMKRSDITLPKYTQTIYIIKVTGKSNRGWITTASADNLFDTHTHSGFHTAYKGKAWKSKVDSLPTIQSWTNWQTRKITYTIGENKVDLDSL